MDKKMAAEYLPGSWREHVATILPNNNFMPAFGQMLMHRQARCLLVPVFWHAV
jgi:hypothetical protein